MREFFISLFWPTLAGVLAAIIVLDQWVLPEPTARQAGGPANSYSEAVARATPGQTQQRARGGVSQESYPESNPGVEAVRLDGQT